MTCGALKQFNAELLCFITAVLLLHKESSIWSFCFQSSVTGEGENRFCGSVISNFKGIIVLIVKIKIKNTDTLPDYSTCQPLEFSCLFWSLEGTSLLQVVGKVKPSSVVFFFAVLSSNVRCYIQNASCFMKTHQQFSLLPLQAFLPKTWVLVNLDQKVVRLCQLKALCPVSFFSRSVFTVVTCMYLEKQSHCSCSPS